MNTPCLPLLWLFPFPAQTRSADLKEKSGWCVIPSWVSEVWIYGPDYAPKGEVLMGAHGCQFPKQVLLPSWGFCWLYCWTFIFLTLERLFIVKALHKRY